MYRFSEYSDIADFDQSFENTRLLVLCFFVVERYIDLLEQAIKREEIPYDEITLYPPMAGRT